MSMLNEQQEKQWIRAGKVREDEELTASVFIPKFAPYPTTDLSRI